MPLTQIHLRLPPALHTELAQAAKDQSMSLNGMLVLLLAGSVGFKLAPDDGPDPGSAA